MKKFCFLFSLILIVINISCTEPADRIEYANAYDLKGSYIPEKPAGLTVTAGSTQNTIEWNTVTGATGYNLYWSTASGLTTAIGTKIGNVSTPYLHQSITNGTTYYYIVTAFNANGESSASDEVSASPVEPTKLNWTNSAPETVKDIAWKDAFGNTDQIWSGDLAVSTTSAYKEVTVLTGSGECLDSTGAPATITLSAGANIISCSSNSAALTKNAANTLIITSLAK